MAETEQFEKLSRELMHVVLELNNTLDGEAGYSQSQIQEIRQSNVLILESVLNALRMLFKC